MKEEGGSECGCRRALEESEGRESELRSRVQELQVRACNLFFGNQFFGGIQEESEEQDIAVKRMGKEIAALTTVLSSPLRSRKPPLRLTFFQLSTKRVRAS